MESWSSSREGQFSTLHVEEDDVLAQLYNAHNMQYMYNV